jgi:hypothetical protein
MTATQPIATVRFRRLDSGEIVASSHMLLQKDDALAVFNGVVEHPAPGVLAYEVALRFVPRPDEPSEVERLRAALVEARNHAHLMVATTSLKWAGTPSTETLQRMAQSAHQRAEKIVAAIDAVLPPES